MVAGERSGCLLRLDPPSGTVGWKKTWLNSISGLALDPVTGRGVVTGLKDREVIVLFETRTGRILARQAARPGACAPCLSRKRGRLFVCNRFENTISAYEWPGLKPRGRLPVLREPVAAVLTPDESLLVVAHSGTHELSLIDGPGLFAQIAARNQEEVIDDLMLLEGCRRRVALPGQGPRALTVRADQVYVAEYFSDAIRIVDLARTNLSISSVLLSGDQEPSLACQGERIFHDATLSHQGWQSCASCHPDGRTDGLRWDLLNDGLGNPKKTKSLVFSHQTSPAMSLGVRETTEQAVRSGFRNILFAVRPEEEMRAVDEYLKSLRPVPSPYLNRGRLSTAARRGKRLFEDPRVGCAGCHPAPLFTDRQAHRVGTETRADQPKDGFDTPSLIECWRTGPYLHDGSAATLREILTLRNRHNQHGRTAHLTPQQLNDLMVYVLSL